MIMGDAAHSMTPYLGSGAAMAIEDGVVFAQLLDSDDTLYDVQQKFMASPARRQLSGKRYFVLDRKWSTDVAVAGYGTVQVVEAIYTEPNGISGTPSLPELYVRVDDRVLSIGTYDSDEHPVVIPEARTIEGAVGKAAVLKLNGEL